MTTSPEDPSKFHISLNSVSRIRRIRSATLRLYTPTAQLGLDYALILCLYLSVYLTRSMLQLLAVATSLLPFFLLLYLFSIQLSSCMHTRYCDKYNILFMHKNRYCREKQAEPKERYRIIRRTPVKYNDVLILNNFLEDHSKRTMTLTQLLTSQKIQHKVRSITHKGAKLGAHD